MDPLLHELYEGGPDEEEVGVIIRLEKGAEPPPHVEVISRFGEEILTARLKRKDIVSTWENHRVASMKAARPVTPQRPEIELEGESEDADGAFGDDGAPKNATAQASLAGV